MTNHLARKCIGKASPAIQTLNIFCILHLLGLYSRHLANPQMPCNSFARLGLLQIRKCPSCNVSLQCCNLNL